MERVRSDDEIADAWVVGEHDLDGSRGAASACALIEDVGDGLRRERVAAMGLGDRGIEIGGAIGVEQVEKPGGGAAEMTAV